MKEPEIVIVIEGGLIVAVGTKNPALVYRIINKDIEENEPKYTDEEADATGIDVEEYTKKFVEED